MMSSQVALRYQQSINSYIERYAILKSTGKYFKKKIPHYRSNAGYIHIKFLVHDYNMLLMELEFCSNIYVVQTGFQIHIGNYMLLQNAI